MCNLSPACTTSQSFMGRKSIIYTVRSWSFYEDELAQINNSNTKQNFHPTDISQEVFYDYTLA